MHMSFKGKKGEILGLIGMVVGGEKGENIGVRRPYIKTMFFER